jgi:multidrug efflux pump subunit AcrA (membrane-fusion protein)
MESSNKTADLSALRIDRDQEPPRGRWVFPVVATLLVVGIGAMVIRFRSTGGFALRAPEVATTRIALVTPVQASTVLTASGYIVARSKAEISPKSVGRIAWLNLEEGQRVKKGELVARLESQELQAQRKQYEAQRQEVQARLENARLEVARARSLWNDKVGTKQSFESWDSQVKGLEAGLQSVAAQIKYVDELIHNAEIYAPIDGVVTVKKAFVGETVAPQGFGGAGSAGATFAVIVDLSSLEM